MVVACRASVNGEPLALVEPQAWRYPESAVLPEPDPSTGGDRALSLIVWLVAFAVLFGAFVLAAGSSRERRSHFWIRVVSMPLVPALVIAGFVGVGEIGLLPDWAVRTTLMLLVFFIIPAMMFVPALLYRRPGSSPDARDDDDDDDRGGGPGPEPPPARPTVPRGGVPLPDAEPSRRRVRDHNRVVFGGPRLRRPAREPERLPTPSRR